MLKIKSNTNEFTIIFSEKIRRKINAEKLSVQPSLFSTFSLFHPSFSFSFNAAPLFFFFCFYFSASFFFFASAFLFFSIHVCPFFQPKNILFNPKQFSLQPKNNFLSPNVFQFFSPNIFQFFFSPNVFQFFSPNIFLQPKRFLLQFSHYSLLLFFYFILFWFSPLFSLSAPPFFLFFSSVYPRPNILSSCFTSLLFE